MIVFKTASWIYFWFLRSSQVFTVKPAYSAPEVKQYTLANDLRVLASLKLTCAICKVCQHLLVNLSDGCQSSLSPITNFSEVCKDPLSSIKQSPLQLFQEVSPINVQMSNSSVVEN